MHDPNYFNNYGLKQQHFKLLNKSFINIKIYLKNNITNYFYFMVKI